MDWLNVFGVESLLLDLVMRVDGRNFGRLASLLIIGLLTIHSRHDIPIWPSESLSLSLTMPGAADITGRHQ